MRRKEKKRKEREEKRRNEKKREEKNSSELVGTFQYRQFRGGKSEFLKTQNTLKFQRDCIRTCMGSRPEGYQCPSNTKFPSYCVKFSAFNNLIS